MTINMGREIILKIFIPSFKEKDSLQYFYLYGNWIKCDESKIMELYFNWSSSKYADRYYDYKGFLIYGYNYIL